MRHSIVGVVISYFVQPPIRLISVLDPLIVRGDIRPISVTHLTAGNVSLLSLQVTNTTVKCEASGKG